ncbi:MAG TPA: alpha/beta hydrolase, partial [Mycolicibacillus parakoreensis]|nr:alpha/beta hydrolase [Mycolicibacillus parakoreensis]
MAKPDRSVAGRVRWFLRARPADYLLELSQASAALPVIGKHLEPLGGATAMGVWGTRHLPEFVANTAKAWLVPGSGATRRIERGRTRTAAAAALADVVPDGDRADWPAPERTPPALRALQHRRYLYRASVRYGSEPTQLLDVWRRRDLPAGRPAPVLIFVPGGAWVHGGRTLQGYALMAHLAQQGWVCLSVEYRVAPHNRWPSHLVDVKTAIAWARANVDKFGGDRGFVAVAGASAGGHLAALAGLGGGDRCDPDLRADLPEAADTSVDAVVPIYGRYDWQDRSTAEREQFVDFLERIVVKKSLRRHPDVFAQASPILRVHPSAPPFLVVHGSRDTVIPVAQARDFVAALRAVSRAPVGYLELPGAGHGFDMTDGVRTGTAVTAIGLFLNEIHRTREQ